MNSRYVVSVLVQDRVGILRDISSAIAGMGGNIDSLSQTVVEGYFTVILTAAFGEAHGPETIRERILCNFRAGEASVAVREHVPVQRSPAMVRGERYVLTVIGKDRPGVVKMIATYLADKQINIEDWFMGISGNDATYVGEVTVPFPLDIKHVQDELAGLGAATGLRVALQHENIFRVTGEVGPVLPILFGRPNAPHE